MSSTELYVAEDGSIYKVNRFQMFSTYQKLSDQEVEKLTGLQHNNIKGKSKASSLAGEPAADFWARTETDVDIHGNDSTK